MNILIAEDDLFSRKLLTATLEKFGHNVVACENGIKAWEAYDKTPVRVIVSDWLMPGTDGLEFCQKVRQRNVQDYTYFILLTANVQGKGSYSEAMDAGIDDFLTKPLDKDQIWMRLRVAERILGYTKQITQLEDMLPICSYCKKVRDDNNYWQQVETYVGDKMGAHFTHGVCPSCYDKKILPELAEMKKNRADKKK
jgi:CheY-like chemotaxis protein